MDNKEASLRNGKDNVLSVQMMLQWVYQGKIKLPEELEQIGAVSLLVPLDIVDLGRGRALDAWFSSSVFWTSSRTDSKISASSR